MKKNKNGDMTIKWWWTIPTNIYPLGDGIKIKGEEGSSMMEKT